jgi:oligopeptide/dipeptide ABC transporter ATP-binding protein
MSLESAAVHGAAPDRPPPALHVEALSVELAVGGGLLEAVGEVSFTLERGRVRGLVGESGCGKSITATALMGLLPRGSRVRGRAELGGIDLVAMNPTERRRVNGRRLAMIFQEPMTALHPMLTVERQVTEGLRHHLGMGRAAARERALELLDGVGIPGARRVLGAHAHELSGGMRQRVMIAMMLACDPEVIIADEPTTALDVTIQAQILDLLEDVVRNTGTSLLLITHDLSVVAQHCDDVTVMYAGRIVEDGPVERVVHHPRHPYTAGLLAARPRRGRHQERLSSILGRVPTLDTMPAGCRFAPRCPRRQDQCDEAPPLAPLGEGRVRCWFPLEDTQHD